MPEGRIQVLSPRDELKFSSRLRMVLGARNSGPRARAVPLMKEMTRQEASVTSTPCRARKIARRIRATLVHLVVNIATKLLIACRWRRQ